MCNSRRAEIFPLLRRPALLHIILFRLGAVSVKETAEHIDFRDFGLGCGYVAHLAGRVPHVGESFPHSNGMSFEVLEMDQSRVNRLRIRVPRKPQEAVS